MNKILGLDEAGRGPVLGDLFIGGVLCSQEQIKFLHENGVTDSKKLTPKKRKELYAIIVENCLDFQVERISIQTIDNNIKSHGKKNLNELEMELMVDLIINLKPNEIYIDAIGPNPKKFSQKIRNLIKERDETNNNLKIIAKNKGDLLFTIVGAASILAKVQRDNIIEKYKKKYIEFGDIGSGYTSDVKTITFLKAYINKYKKIPPIARKSWETTERLYKEIISQKKLTDFL